MDTSTKETNRRMLILRGAGALAVVGANVLAGLFADRLPVLNLLASAVCWYVGKVLGVPLDDVLRQTLTRNPTAAVELAASAIRSMPPAARSVLASIPPEADAQRVAVVLLNTTEPPPPPPRATPGE